MSALLTNEANAFGDQLRAKLDSRRDELRRELEAEAARLLTDATSIRFTLSDDRPAREVPQPKIERHLTQFEIDARPPKLKRRALKQLRARFISRALLKVDSYRSGDEGI